MNSAIKEAHFKSGEDWEDNTIKSLRSQRNWMMIFAIIAMVTACAAVGAVMALTPLKKTEPFVIEVDKATGKAEVLNVYDGDVQKLSVQDMLAKYFINKYLVARESFSPNLDIEENYVLVQGLSEGVAFSNYAKRFTESSPENPFKKYGTATAEVEVLSISFLRGDTASVRYRIIERRGQEADRTQTLIEILNYKFVNVPTKEAERLKNPLGFRVTEYRTDTEIVK